MAVVAVVEVAEATGVVAEGKHLERHEPRMSDSDNQLLNSENGDDAVVGAESGYEAEEDESNLRTKIARLEEEDKGT